MRPPAIRVLVADDHDIVRAGLTYLVESAEDMHLVAEASCGTEALLLAGRTDPDVVLIDVAMPGMSGAKAMRRLVRRASPARVLVHSGEDCPEVVQAAREAGAAGYVVEGGTARKVLDAIRAVHEGLSVWPADPGPRGGRRQQCDGEQDMSPRD